MTTSNRVVIWFNRFVLAGAALVMTAIAIRNLWDPIGATRPLDIALQSASAVTIVRVGFGGFPLGFAAALIGCVISTRRLLTGTALVLAIVGGAPPSRASRACSSTARPRTTWA
jgi:hypothetical protein